MKLSFLLPALLGMVSFFFEAQPSFRITENNRREAGHNAAAPQVTTSTLSAAADAYTINGTSATTNYGTATSLLVKTTTASGYARATYLKFPLGSVSGTITAATLRIYGHSTEAGITTQLAAYGISDDSWTESGITWNTAPAAGATALSTINVGTASQYYSFDVTSFVQAQLAGDKTVSLLVKQPSNLNHLLQFNSKENSSNRPQLVLTVSTAPANQAPVLAAISNQSVTAGQPLSFTATASDGDAGQTLTYSLSGAPSGASINASTGVFSWTPPASGSASNATFSVIATDNGSPALSDQKSVSVSVAPSNHAPVLAAISNQTVTLNQPVTFTASATDVDGQTLRYALSGAGDGEAIDSVSGVFSWTPATAGTYPFNVVATDNGSPVLSDQKPVTITVVANQAPVVAPINDTTITAGQTLSFTASATDPEGQTLSYSLINAPAGASIDAGTGAFSWTTAVSNTQSSATFSVVVTDNGSPNMSDSEQLTVTVAPSNHAPVLAAIGNKYANSGQTVSFTAHATDADSATGQTVSYSLGSDAPGGATIDPSSGAFSWTSSSADTATFTLIASDNGNPAASDSELVTITVTANQPPVLAHIPLEQYINAGQSLTFTASASDPDSSWQTLRYSLPVAPDGATIDSVTGVFTWTSTVTDTEDDYPVTVRVSDNGTPAKYDEEQIVIVVSPANRPPVLDSIGVKTVTVGQPLTFTATASDSDANQTENFYLIDAPDSAALDASTGVFSWTPDSVGTFTFTVHVSDDGEPALTDEQQVTVKVIPVNQPPVLAPVGDKTITAGQALTFTATADDIDSTQTLSYSLSGAPGGASINANTGAFSWTPAAAGSFPFTVVVTDNGSPALSDSEHITVTVNSPAKVTVAPLADAYTINGTSATTNYGTATSLLVKTTTASGYARATYLKFALGSVTSVTSATLRIYGHSTEAGITTQLAAYGISDDSWTESGITWNTAPAAGATALSTINVGTASQYYSFDVTSFVQAQLAGDKTVSLLVKQPSNLNHLLQFNSKENSSNRPQLVITTTTGTAGNQAPVLNSIGNKTVMANQTLNFTASASDGDAGQTLTYSLSGAPSGASINASTGVFSWTPAASGSATFKVQVTDNGSPALSDDEQITVTVSTAATTTTFANNQSTIIPNPGTVNIPITVSGLPSQIDTAAYGLQSLTVKITHPADNQLTLQLKSPDGKVIYLFRNSPGVNINTTFDAVATKFIDNNEIATYTGSFTSNYRPRQDLAMLNNGHNPNGTWMLIVNDNSSDSTAGRVTGVTLTFGPSPAKPLLVTSTLPIIKIYTNGGADIIADSKILATINIINNSGGTPNNVNQTNYQFTGTVGIAIRGNSSATLATIPKRQYSVETRLSDGVTNLDTSLFGLPKENDWILSAVMTDKSLMRNVLTYQIARDMGWWASHTQYCEVMINDEYRGVFTFEEKIKRDKGRVNIKDLGTSDTTQPKVTGGYIFSVDDLSAGAVTWQTKIAPKFRPFQFVFPKAEDVQPAQKAYLQSYVDSFEAALHGSNFQDPVNGFRKFAVDNSFIDYFLVSELSKNKDGYRASTYFYKDRGGKIVAQPVWDYDAAWSNDVTCNMNIDTGFIYRDMAVCPKVALVPWWWARLLQDAKYNHDMICRYVALRQTTLSQAHLFHIIDSAAAVLNAGGQQRNFIRWNIWGKYVVAIPKPYQTSYAGEISALKQWITGRLAWLDNAWGTTCPSLTTTRKADGTTVVAEENSIGRVYPSPFSDHLSVGVNVSKEQTATIRLLDISGKLVYEKSMSLQKGSQLIQVDLSGQHMANGLYLLQVNGPALQLSKKVFKQQ